MDQKIWQIMQKIGNLFTPCVRSLKASAVRVGNSPNNCINSLITIGKKVRNFVTIVHFLQREEKERQPV